MGLEKIVRPFQTREITPPRVAITGNQVSVAGAVTATETVKVTIGRSGSVKTVSGSETLDVSYYMKKWMKEKLSPEAENP